MTVEEALLFIDQLFEQRCFSKVEEIVFRQVWEGRSYADIAQASGYDAGYIKDTGYKLWQLLSTALGQKVTKHNVQSILKRVALKQRESNHQRNEPKSNANSWSYPPALSNKVDWGEATDISVFYGRINELKTLSQWIVDEDCRLVTIVGIGGGG
ncbi:hypothetical protein H6G97_38720 [Nostoc flagelliforme FACHB-838]|uniref:vWA-MoxR associated protein N-terminal HTH domain-containing protein n=1 Tax=Nostoc flagelliforme FACHB-838 TaxID=2692904 RepID=A0ABR8E0F4_9NOSO|nr:hypothetical protein [Nostoc flagelliforme]MBD2535039.1 hypothetical protein [Nostoc flagelliforme FACHB-838]